MKFIIALVMLFASTAVFAHNDTDTKSTPSVVNTYNNSYSLPTNSDDRGLLIGATAAGTVICNSIVREKYGSAGKFICAVGVMSVAGLRRHPNLGAAAVGVGAGTILSYAWKF
jgi:hypothetical protein